MSILKKIAFISTILLNACSANHYSVHEIAQFDSEKSAAISVDAKRRFLLSNVITRTVDESPPEKITITTTPATNKTPETTTTETTFAKGMITEKIRRYCAEPSPDVFSVLSQSASGGGSFGQTADPKSVNVSLQGAFSNSETGSTIARTQTVNMLKEMMYRTCERYLNGQIGDFEYSAIAARDQRIMISILAIEQLTGTLPQKPIVIAATGSGSTGQATSEAILSLDNADKKVAAQKKVLDEAQKEFAKVDDPVGACAALLNKKVDEVSGDDASKRQKCSEVTANKDKAAEDLKEAKAKYDAIVNLAGKPGASSATTSAHFLSKSATTETDKQIEQIRSQTIGKVADVVEKIVEKSFVQDDETSFFCYRILEQNKNTKVIKSCNDFLMAKIGNETARFEFKTKQVMAIEINKVIDSIRSLTPEQALTAEKSLPVPMGFSLAKMKEKQIVGKRLTDGEAAKKALEIRAIYSDSNNELREISTAVSFAVQG